MGVGVVQSWLLGTAPHGGRRAQRGRQSVLRQHGAARSAVLRRRELAGVPCRPSGWLGASTGVSGKRLGRGRCKWAAAVAAAVASTAVAAAAPPSSTIASPTVPSTTTTSLRTFAAPPFLELCALQRTQNFGTGDGYGFVLRCFACPPEQLRRLLR